MRARRTLGRGPRRRRHHRRPHRRPDPRRVGRVGRGIRRERAPGRPRGFFKRGVLKKYTADTWRSMDAMTVGATGLPADNIGGDLDPATRSEYTSPTNIGAYLWTAAAARDDRLIGRAEATRRMATTIASIGRLERHEPSGMFYNWYDPATLEKLRVWPVDGSTVQPFLSSVDNAWLATGLLLAARAAPSLADRADRPARRWTSASTTRPRAPAARSAAGSGTSRPLAARSPTTTATGARTSTTPATTTARSTPSRGWRRTRDRGRPDPCQALLRHVPHLPGRQLRLVVETKPVGPGRSPTASRSSRVRCPIAG